VLGLSAAHTAGSSPTTNCSRFHTIVTDDTCWNLADPAKGYGYGLSPGNAGVNELLAMNPGLICDDPVNNPLQIGQRVCVTAGAWVQPGWMLVGRELVAELGCGRGRGALEKLTGQTCALRFGWV
jgi:hypothetical protein